MIRGIGTDIVQVSRMGDALRRFGDRFARRVLTEAERARFDGHPHPAAFLAKRFAAKEAAAKALGTGFARGLSWQDIEVANDALGAPRLQLHGRARQLQLERGIDRLHISLSDEQAYVVAFVILESGGRPPEGEV